MFGLKIDFFAKSSYFFCLPKVFIFWNIIIAVGPIGYASHKSSFDFYAMVWGTTPHLTTDRSSWLGGEQPVVKMLVSDPSRNRASQLRRKRRGSNARAAISTTGSASSRASDAVGHGMGGVLQQGPFPSPRQASREHRPSQREPHGGNPNASFHSSLQSLPAALDHACAPLNLHRSLAHHPRLHGPLHEVR